MRINPNGNLIFQIRTWTICTSEEIIQSTCISELNRNKSPGFDNLLPDCFIDSKDLLHRKENNSSNSFGIIPEFRVLLFPSLLSFLLICLSHNSME